MGSSQHFQVRLTAIVFVLVALGPSSALGAPGMAAQDTYKSPDTEAWAAEEKTAPAPAEAEPVPVTAVPVTAAGEDPTPAIVETAATEEEAEPEAEPAVAEPEAKPAQEEWTGKSERREDLSYKNRLVFTTGSFIVGGMGGGEFGYDRVVSKYMTLDFDISFLYLGFGSTNLFGLAGRLGFSIFFEGSAPAGWNLNIGASAGSLFIDGDAAFIFDAQFLLGHKWVMKNHVTFGIGVGLSYLYYHWDEDLSIGGAAPSVGLDFGYAW